MSAVPDPVKAFNDELAEMLTQKPPVSSSKMKEITRCAMRATKYYKHVVMSVEKLIQKCKAEYKLSGIYVIDAIVRQSKHQNKDKDMYAPRFESNIHVTATFLFKCSNKDQVKIARTFKLWELNKVFSYHTIQKCLNNASPDARKDGIKLAEDSFSKMAVSVKPVITSDIAQQQLELEEQRRNIKQQEEELRRKQEVLLSQTSIPPILGNLLQFGQLSSTDKKENLKEKRTPNSDTAYKVKSLLDDFDYSDEEDMGQPQGKKNTPKGTPKSNPKGTPKDTQKNKPSVTPKDRSDGARTPSPVGYSLDPPVTRYDTRDMEKLYTPSPIEKIPKRSKHKSKSPEKKTRDKPRKSTDKLERTRDKRDKSRDRRARDESREELSRDEPKPRDEPKSRDRSGERRRSRGDGRKSGKRSRSASPAHHTKRREVHSKPDCVTILTTTIWIGNLRKTVTKDDISSLMKKYTNEFSVDMVPPRGCCYINMEDRDTAERVVRELRDLKLHGAPCKVAWAPGKGCKEHKDHWNIEKGITFLPHKTFERVKVSKLEEGGVIEEETLPTGTTLQGSEGAGTILEKLLVSMKSGPCEEPAQTNGEHLARREEAVSAKLDQLGLLTKSTKKTRLQVVQKEESSIARLLNSEEYSQPMPDETGAEEYFYESGGISPPVTLEVPASPVPEEPLPYSRLEEPLPYSRPEEALPYSRPVDEDSPSKLERKSINLQTYLKRKKDDDSVEEAPVVQEPSPEESPTKEPETKPELGDDLLEWASQDADEAPVVETGERSPIVEEETTPTEVKEEMKEEDETAEDEEIETPTDLMETTRDSESTQEEPESERKIANIKSAPSSPEIAPEIAAIKSPPSSPEMSPNIAAINSPLLSPEIAPEIAAIKSPPSSPDTPPQVAVTKSSSPETPRQVALTKSSRTSRARSPLLDDPKRSARGMGGLHQRSPRIPDKEEGELESEADKPVVPARSRSESHSSRKSKKKKKKKKSKKKLDSDLEEDIRKLEFLKAELEREERREKKHRKKQSKRSPPPEKIKKEKRQRR